MVNFYRLTYPRYETDSEYITRNPIQPIHKLWLPGLICSACGETWAGSWRRYRPLPDRVLQPRLSGKPLPEREWRELADAVRRSAGLSDDVKLAPGEIFGPPVAELESQDVADFLQPLAGGIFVQENVVAAIESAGLTGVRPLRVEVRWGKRVRHPPSEPPTLYELLVTGHAWRVGMDLERITVCPQCQRTVFPDPERLAVDESRWDGSDFFNVDCNPNVVLVTERVCETIIRNRFTNVACVPVG